MKKITSMACGVALSMGAVAANAFPVTLIGTSQTNLAVFNHDLAHADYSGSGVVNLAGGVFDSANFIYSSHVTSAADATIDATIFGTIELTAAGIMTETYTGCTGSIQVCSPVVFNNPVVIDLNTVADGHYDFSDLSTLTWGYSETKAIPGAGGLPPSITVYSYTTLVPVPAAIWLFGSALLGLAGIGRQCKAA